jgi:hypothetical protein
MKKTGESLVNIIKLRKISPPSVYTRQSHSSKRDLMPLSTNVPNKPRLDIGINTSRGVNLYQSNIRFKKTYGKTKISVPDNQVSYSRVPLSGPRTYKDVLLSNPFTKGSSFISRSSSDVISRNTGGSIECIQKRYASYSIKKPDPINKDPQAKINNEVNTSKGLIYHPKVSRQTYYIPDCSHKACDNIIKEESIGHTRHGTPNISHRTLIEVDTSTDFSNKPKSQKVVMCKKPHKSSATQKVLQQVEPR